MNEGYAPHIVSSAEITRNFGVWQHRAAQGPLIVTHHGRPRCVLLSIETWRQGGHTGHEDAGANGLVGQDLLAERIDGAFLAIDAQGLIRRANSYAALLLGHPREELAGLALTDLVPAWSGGPAAAQFQRTLKTGEMARIMVPFGDGQARADIFPWPDGVALLLRRVDEDQARERRLARAHALDAALSVRGETGVVELGVRATIARADEGFAILSGFPSERLAGVRVTDLLTLATRVPVAEAVERLLTDGEGKGESAAVVDADLLVNGGDARPVRIALAALREGYAVAGVLMLVTPAPIGQEASGRKSGTDR